MIKIPKPLPSYAVPPKDKAATPEAKASYATPHGTKTINARPHGAQPLVIELPQPMSSKAKLSKRMKEAHIRSTAVALGAVYF